MYNNSFLLTHQASLKQRMGTVGRANVKARLNLGAVRGRGGGGFSRGQRGGGRGQRGGSSLRGGSRGGEGDSLSPRGRCNYWSSLDKYAKKS